MLRIGLLTVSTSILVIITAALFPVSLGALAVILMIVTSLTFLLSPAMLESKIESRWLNAESFSDLSKEWPPDEEFSSS